MQILIYQNNNGIGAKYFYTIGMWVSGLSSAGNVVTIDTAKQDTCFLQDCSDSRGHYPAEHLQAGCAAGLQVLLWLLLGSCSSQNHSSALHCPPEPVGGPPGKGWTKKYAGGWQASPPFPDAGTHVALPIGLGKCSS